MTTVNTTTVNAAGRAGERRAEDDIRPEEHWRRRAACAGFDTAFFFPEDEDEAATGAREICARCPVREDCLEYALANRQDEGIWGGLTGGERRRLRRRRRDAARRAAAAA